MKANKITKRVNVNVPISESDLTEFNEIVYDDEVMSWVFEDRTGKYLVSMTFMSDIEADEMSDRDTQLEHWSRERL